VIAVLGATGYLGRSLSRVLAQQRRSLVLFARNIATFAELEWPSNVELRALSSFHGGEFELVINAIGAGDPTRVGSMDVEILELTNFWDQLVLATMSPRTRYVFLSSGAIYNTRFDQPMDADSKMILPVNRLETVPPYTIAKLYAEAYHRHARARSILDIRIFGYADVAIRTDGKFFLAELTRSLVERRIFVTSPHDMIRDYAGVSELLALIQCWENAGAPNRALDLYTRAPVGKFALLDAVAQRFGLDIRKSAEINPGPTGTKTVYTSAFRAAAELGYDPQRTALEVVLEMLEARLALAGSLCRLS